MISSTPKSFLFTFFVGLALIATNSAYAMSQNEDSDQILHRVRRGNYGERYSGGIGAQSSLGNGYGGTNIAGASFSGVTGPQVVFDSLALKAVSVPNNAFVAQYQAQINAAASSAAGLDRLQQQGQHAAAYAGAAANQVGQWYNVIATGHVPAGYKGENGRRR